MMNGAETVDSPENVQAETGHHVSTYHRGNATEKEFHPQVGGGQEIMVPPFWQSRARSSTKSSAKQKPRGDSSQTVLRCRVGKARTRTTTAGTQAATKTSGVGFCLGKAQRLRK